MQKNWPGNVRQLRSTIRQVAAFGAGRDEITMSDLQELTEI